MTSWYLVIPKSLNVHQDANGVILAAFPITRDAVEWIDNQTSPELYRIAKAEVNVSHIREWKVIGQ